MRAIPASRRHPQSGREALERALAAAGIHYVWEGSALGGWRKPVQDSLHIALKDDAIRAYADHMMSAAFRDGLDRLLGLASREHVAIMCAERLPSQCHRNLISDSAVARGIEVRHLVDRQPAVAHALSPAARVNGAVLVYDGNSQLPLV